MRSILFVVILASLLSPTLLKAQKSPNHDVEISGSVLKTAEWAGFKYKETLEKVIAGDQKATKDFLEFSGTVDGTEALQHAVTCLELIPLAGDEKIGSIIYILKPKLKSVLLDRFQLAQGRTKKTELLKPMQEWAPLTWKALNGERVVCSSCNQNSGGLSAKPGEMQKPGAAKAATPPTQVSGSDRETNGKQ